VMAAPADLVETIARFHPKIVRMADGGEKAEDQARLAATPRGASFNDTKIGTI
jgi:hypothetical protein